MKRRFMKTRLSNLFAFKKRNENSNPNRASLLKGPKKTTRKNPNIDSVQTVEEEKMNQMEIEKTKRDEGIAEEDEDEEEMDIEEIEKKKKEKHNQDTIAEVAHHLILKNVDFFFEGRGISYIKISFVLK
jgi:hypothetical protein